MRVLVRHSKGRCCAALIVAMTEYFMKDDLLHQFHRPFYLVMSAFSRPGLPKVSNMPKFQHIDSRGIPSLGLQDERITPGLNHFLELIQRSVFEDWFEEDIIKPFIQSMGI